jgi:hypothetical protein
MIRSITITLLTFLLLLFSVGAYAQTKVIVVPLGGDSPPDKYVFVTRGIWNGDLGGPEGADAKCQEEADADGSLVRGRTFMAWISGNLANDFSINGEGRNFKRSYGPYRQPSGTLVAKDYDDLINNGPTNPIIEHADSDTDTVTIGTFAWTGINQDGSYSDDRCTDENGNDWSTFISFQYGASGDDSGPYNWTNSSQFSQYSCDYRQAVYCFEQ